MENSDFMEDRTHWLKLWNYIISGDQTNIPENIPKPGKETVTSQKVQIKKQREDEEVYKFPTSLVFGPTPLITDPSTRQPEGTEG
jgi:hypothetical protein